MSAIINSSSQFQKILDSSKIVIADFYADWCGPCKAIAPTYEQFASKYSKPNRIAFVKVNVENHQDISQRYGVRALPTFLIFQSGSVVQTIRGADQSGLRNAIESIIKSVGSAGPVYSSEGRTLGSTSNQARPASKPFDFRGFLNLIFRFLALYFTTLFSLDAYGAGENSPFNVNRSTMRPTISNEKTSARRLTGGRKLGTVADL